MHRSILIILGGIVLASLPASALYAQDQSNAESFEFFEKNIRPVLVKECYSCHAADAKEIQGGLTLDTRDGMLAGGDIGPAVVPGNVRKSLIIAALKQVDDDLQMPPDKKLDDATIANFVKWIEMGAADPRKGEAKSSKYEINIDTGREFWSFQPPKKSAPPVVKNAAWPHNDIDRFLLTELESKGLQPVEDADARTLLRRLYFDLTGLPPSIEQIASFVKQHAADPQAAVLATVDELLDSPAFGERWGRHWLDVARYAESSGRASNVAYPHAWRYRDYVIDAFNADKPYDQFIREQLSGDLLKAENDDQRAEQMVATGFLAIGPKTHNEFNRRQFAMDLIDEQIDVTFQAFQGLTVACARCHDHKFDPIPQEDYYALAGIFNSSETCYGTIRTIQSNQPSDLLQLPDGAKVYSALPKLTSERRDALEKQIADQRKQMAEVTGDNAFLQRLFMQTRIATLRSQLDSYDSDGNPKPLAMGVRDRRFGADMPVYVRGEIDQPGKTVQRGFPQVLTTRQPDIYQGSGRWELARWISSSKNPLTARVMVNRIWLHLIGRGIVPTPDNFGASGLPPSHPELLDYLAVSFMENGWSVKQLIREIVSSHAYQLSSDYNKGNFEVDPDNTLVWRMPKRRLEAESIRDTMLLLGGELKETPPLGSVVAIGGEGGLQFRFRGGDPSLGDTNRSVYLPIIRDQLPEVLMLFDFPDPSLIVGERATTTIPAQSLFLMNNPFVIRQADGLANYLLSDAGDDRDRVNRAYQLCFSRPPTEAELYNAEQFMKEYDQSHTRRSTWAAFCQALFASSEFAHR